MSSDTEWQRAEHIPTSAVAIAGASFTPSPSSKTPTGGVLERLHLGDLVGREQFPVDLFDADLGRQPAHRPLVAPVTNTGGRLVSCFSAATDAAASGRSRSARPSTPATAPSTRTITAVCPASSSSSSSPRAGACAPSPASGVIFVAELGDKSQLMALTFAARYRARDVLLGITAATALVHLASVAIGAFIDNQFADRQGTISIIAGIAFLIFAWTLRGDELSEDEADKARSGRGAAMVAVGVAFFLAELGDKPMLATITLATTEGWLGTWIGSTHGMVLADALAIGVGALLGRHLPERAIKYGAAAAFVVFGLLLIASGAGWL